MSFSDLPDDVIRIIIEYVKITNVSDQENPLYQLSIADFLRGIVSRDNRSWGYSEKYFYIPLGKFVIVDGVVLNIKNGERKCRGCVRRVLEYTGEWFGAQLERIDDISIYSTECEKCGHIYCDEHGGKKCTRCCRRVVFHLVNKECEYEDGKYYKKYLKHCFNKIRRSNCHYDSDSNTDTDFESDHEIEMDSESDTE